MSKIHAALDEVRINQPLYNQITDLIVTKINQSEKDPNVYPNKFTIAIVVKVENKEACIANINNVLAHIATDYASKRDDCYNYKMEYEMLNDSDRGFCYEIRFSKVAQLAD